MATKRKFKIGTRVRIHGVLATVIVQNPDHPDTYMVRFEDGVEDQVHESEMEHA